MKKDDNEIFFLNRNRFIKDFLPIYNSNKKDPKYLIQFPIMIPFHIPFPEGTCYTVFLNDGNAITMHFTNIIYNDAVMKGVLSKDRLIVSQAKSRVEITYVNCNDNTLPTGEEYINHVFDSSICILNFLILSYLVCKKDIDAHQITKEMLEFSVIYRYIEVSNWKTSDGLFLLHFEVPYDKKVLDKNELEKVIWYSNVIKDELNPFIVSEIMMLNSKRQFKQGFYKEAVISAQISIETFLNTLLIELLKNERYDEIYIQNKIDNIGFISRIKNEYHKRLGGSWNPEMKDSIIGKWYINAYLLRNKIAHAGYEPNFRDIDEAIHSSIEFKNYVIDRLKIKKEEYPEILNFFS